jgi:hypothetical protein
VIIVPMRSSQARAILIGMSDMDAAMATMAGNLVLIDVLLTDRRFPGDWVDDGGALSSLALAKRRRTPAASR